MKKLILILLIISTTKIYGQSDKVYYNLDSARVNPSNVYNLQISCTHHDYPLSDACTEFPIDIALFSNLRKLYFCEAKLNCISDSINRLKRLHSLTFANCNILNLEKELYKLSGLDSLKYLGIWMSNLSYLPNCINDLKELTSIDISFNTKLNLYKTIKLLAKKNNIESLDLSGWEKQKFIPRNLKRIKSLKQIELNYWKNINQKETFRILSNMDLKALSLKNCFLDNLCSNLTKLKHLEYLNISENSFAKIPESIYNLYELKYLIIDWNGFCKDSISSIDKNIEQLVNLNVLSLRGNHQLKDIKDLENISKCKSIKYLDLAGCGYENLPEIFSNLDSLQKFIFTGRKNTDYPKVFEILSHNKSLNQLIINSSNLKYLPNEIGLLKNLEYLDLSESLISELPDNFFKLKNLKELNIYGVKLSKSSLDRIKTNFPDLKITYNFNFYKEINYR